MTTFPTTRSIRMVNDERTHVAPLGEPHDAIYEVPHVGGRVLLPAAEGARQRIQHYEPWIDVLMLKLSEEGFNHTLFPHIQRANEEIHRMEVSLPICLHPRSDPLLYPTP